MEIKMVRCPNGHYYNAALHESCPECSQEVGRTEAVPDSVIGRTEIMGGDTVGKTEVVTPPVPDYGMTVAVDDAEYEENIPASEFSFEIQSCNRISRTAGDRNHNTHRPQRHDQTIDKTSAKIRILPGSYVIIQMNLLWQPPDIRIKFCFILHRTKKHPHNRINTDDHHNQKDNSTNNMINRDFLLHTHPPNYRHLHVT